ncbi:DNA-directed RNA polymerase specialized sigma24 family protein [Rhodococcus sp. 27YEA15]|uniref:RNA polymerase sigma factor n=1 Tax=Rhodococcus sp. 27YEA15 TaxID=3156259 RepID=UPI003C7BED4E
MTLKPFEDVVAEHGAVVLRVCRAVVGPAEADDAWSETFIAAMRAYPALDDDANVEAWLVTIAHRKAIDITRVRGRSAVPTDVVPDAPSGLGVPGAWDHELWDALEKLPFKQRSAVAYHFLGGLPYAAVAEILGNTPAAARRAGADGIAALRKTYLPNAFPEGSHL